MQNKILTPKTHFLAYYSMSTLEEYIRSGISYMINSFVNSNDRLINLRYYSQELILAVDFLIKSYYLKRENATYSEYFYSLQRQSKHIRNPLITALILSFYPYIRNKLDGLYNKIKMNKDYVDMSVAQKIYSGLYPALYTITELLDLALKFKYLILEKHKYYDIMFWILKVKLVYKNSAAQTNNALLDLINKPFVFALFIAYKALSWYYSARSAQNNTYIAGRNIPAPFKQEQLSRKNVCPICAKSITNPAALSSSGYVFCYSCITGFVKSNQKCPITNISTTEECIHVIYS